MNKYERDKVIGSGTFGTVWLVKSKLSSLPCVLKEIDLTSLTSDERKRAFSEVAVLSVCNHENIIRYKDCVIDHLIGKLCIIMEYADNGDLRSAILRQNGVPFPEINIISWFIQMCLALQYIHFQNILHRDLKPTNIFLTKNNTIKIGDFGISRFLKDNQDFATTRIGTPYYLSPEMCRKKPKYNQRSDMWALGCVLFELSALEHPFKAVDFVQLIKLILHGKRKELPSWSCPLIHELVENLLNTDPSVRYSAEEILEIASLQPYLTHFLSNHRSRKNASCLVNTRKLTNEDLKSSKEYSAKRVTSNLSPQPSKLRATSEGKKYVKADQFVSSLKTPKYHHKLPPSTETNLNQYEITYINPSTRNEMLMDSSKNKVIMNLTYTVSDKSNDERELDIFSEDKNEQTNAVDHGYQSEETNICCSDEKVTKDSGLLREKPEDRESEKSSLLFGCKEDELNSTENSFTHCQHGQCHQCMLDMLWKNRIRGSVDVSINIKEYTKLRKKLLRIFQDDLFKKIYQSLLNDWEERDASSPRASINQFMKYLNYEQVQTLPLMMQLVQLDIQMTPKKSYGAKTDFSSNSLV